MKKIVLSMALCALYMPLHATMFTMHNNAAKENKIRLEQLDEEVCGTLEFSIAPNSTKKERSGRKGLFNEAPCCVKSVAYHDGSGWKVIADHAKLEKLGGALGGGGSCEGHFEITFSQDAASAPTIR